MYDVPASLNNAGIVISEALMATIGICRRILTILTAHFIEVYHMNLAPLLLQEVQPSLDALPPLQALLP
jgi:hypothetical protein